MTVPCHATGMSDSGVLTRVPWLEESRSRQDDGFDQREPTVLAQIGTRSWLVGGDLLACFRAPYRLNLSLCYYRIMKAGRTGGGVFDSFSRKMARVYCFRRDSEVMTGSVCIGEVGVKRLPRLTSQRGRKVMGLRNGICCRDKVMITKHTIFPHQRLIDAW